MEALPVEELRDAVAFARAFYEGDLEGAALVYGAAPEPARIAVALADVLGSMVADLADYRETSEDDVWQIILDCLDHPIIECIPRKRQQ